MLSTSNSMYNSCLEMLQLKLLTDLGCINESLQSELIQVNDFFGSDCSL